MPPPSVSYCILCEDVRREVGNKLAVLGFFGVLPDVKILLEPDEESVRLVFLVSFGKGAGEYSITPHILTPLNNSLVTGAPHSITFRSEADGTGAAFVFQGLQLDLQGDYTFLLTTQEKEIYRTSFNITRGQVPTFM